VVRSCAGTTAQRLAAGAAMIETKARRAAAIA
jgi:hypothetical protein